MTVAVKFCGAAATVTGSCYVVEHPGGRLLVDCGLFQGPKTLRELNYGPFPFEVAAVDAVLLTHAHIDHSGLLPKLALQGFAGPVIATPGTIDLLGVMLPDTGAIQESEVERLNRRNVRRGRPEVQPIYTRRDAEAMLTRLQPVDYEAWSEIGPGVRARFWNAGHILGAASVELELATGDPRRRFLRVLFSGDIGPGGKMFHPDPDAPENYDHLIVEATYGDRDRADLAEAERQELLRAEVAAAMAAGGNLIVPAFAVERTQELLCDLLCLIEDGRLPKLQIFLDSPLAIRATEVFERHLNSRAPGSPCPQFRAPNVRFVETAEESASLARINGGAVFIAGSGMCDAGRVRQHLKNNLWRPGATVLLVGFQAPGTLGHLLDAGAARVRIHGEEIAVKARIRRLDVYSGHAGRTDLLDWVRARLPVGSVFLCHGEEAALESMRDGVAALGMDRARVLIPRLDQTFVLDRAGRATRLHTEAPPRLAPYAAAAVTAGRDWHNDYAALMLDLQHRLQEAPDDAERMRLLKRARRLLER